ncbi:hypothetical protein D9M72_412970 [compost metagenome]
MLRIPGAGDDIPVPRGAAEDVLAGARRPPRCAGAERGARGDAQRCRLRLHVGHQRLVRVAEVGGLGAPVVHLNVDVVVIVAGPRGVVAVVPQPLQVGRQPTRARRAGEQVAAVVEHDLLEPRIGHGGLERLQAQVGRQRTQRRRGLGAPGRLHAHHARREIVRVPGHQRLQAAGRGGGHALADGGHRVTAGAPAGVVRRRVVGARIEHQQQAVAVGEAQFVADARQRAAGRDSAQHRAAAQPVAQR